nr:hypothetical protein [Mycoplasmopsis bovis]
MTLLDVVSPSVYEVPSSVLGFSVTFLESSFLTGSLISFSSYFISWSFKNYANKLGLKLTILIRFLINLGNINLLFY